MQSSEVHSVVKCMFCGKDALSHLENTDFLLFENQFLTHVSFGMLSEMPGAGDPFSTSENGHGRRDEGAADGQFEAGDKIEFRPANRIFL